MIQTPIVEDHGFLPQLVYTADVSDTHNICTLLSLSFSRSEMYDFGSAINSTYICAQCFTFIFS